MNNYNKWQNDLIQLLVALRRDKNLTQQQLSDLCGIKQPVIARIESGKSSPKLSTLFKLLNCLNAEIIIVPTHKKYEDNIP